MAGMGDESIDLSKLGTALFAFGFVLVAVLSIFGVGKSITNSGSEKVVTQLDTIEQSEFDDYDQTTVIGTKLKAAYGSLEGKPYAIVVATRSMIDKYSGASSDCPGLILTGTDAAPQITIKNFPAENSKGAVVNNFFGINYNARLKETEVEMDNGYFKTKDTFVTNAGVIQYYSKVTNMKKVGTAEYIPTGAKYMSSLVKDSTGSTCGVVFVQTTSN